MHRLFALLGAFLFVFASSATHAQSQANPRGFFEAATPRVPANANAPGVQSKATPVKLNAAAMRELRYLDEVELALPGRTYHVVFELAQEHGRGVLTWVGHIKGLGHHGRVIVATGPGGSFGTIDTPEGSFRIVPGGEHDWLVDMTEEQLHIPITRLADDGVMIDQPLKSAPDLSKARYELAIPGVNSVALSKATPFPQAVIDLMIVVTRGLADRLGTTLATRLAFLVTRANTSYADSGIAITLRLVNFTVVNYADDANDNRALGSITPSCTSSSCSAGFDPAVFGGIEAIRTQYGADLVAFLRNGASFGGSGLAYVPGPSNAAFMYSTVQGCVLGCESVFIHEVGHNMGNKHDRATSSWQGGGTPNPSPGTFSYSFGYAFCKSGALSCDPTLPSTAGGCSSQPECSTNDASNFRDIMAYFHGTAQQTYKFSNPNVTCMSTAQNNDGIARPCGVGESAANSANTALSMNNNRTQLSAIHATAVAAAMPGSLQFSSGAFSGSETAGTVTFTVSRVNGSGGPVSVTYAVTGGSATAGVDFAVQSGTLTWADGDAADKTFSITLTNDMAAEGIETFTATLSNPAGAAGVYLGYPTTAVGFISEDWGGTVGGPLPSGFATTGGWTVANDQAYEGTTSLRSAQVFGDMTNYTNSDLTFTGVVPAGVIAFAYRVSSYQSYGVFEFIVDGTTVFSDTGETGWKSYLYTLATGGTHTLTWRFKNRLSSACNSGWNPPPQGGSACADRVWIDSVSLPLTLTTPSISLASSVNPSASGQSVTLTATVAGTSGTPAGTVQFRDGASVIAGCSAQALASGSATCSTSALAPGTHTITAVYSGSTTYATLTSSALTQVVASGPQLLTASPSRLDFGGQSMNTTSPAQTTTLTNAHTSPITVTSVTPPAGFTVSGNTCATLAVGATCQVTVTFTPAASGSLDGSLLVSYAAGGPTVVSLAGTGERSLVTHYYRSILRRAPDAGGKGFWEAEATRVQGLGSSVNEVWFAMAQSFYFSPEYLAQNRDNTGFVTDMYNTFFNRAPDAAGLAYWVGQLDAGMPREVVLVSYMFSGEFATFTQAIFGNVAVRREVDTVVDFYRGLLARLPDDGGFNFWVQRFRAAQCSGSTAVTAEVEAISSAYAGSAEYAARSRSHAQYVGDLYNAFLRRGGDLAGVQFWISQIATGARTREAVRREFVASAEFNARVNAIIQQGCL